MENNFDQDKTIVLFAELKKAMQTAVLAMSNFSNFIRDGLTRDQVILSCVERIKNYHIYFNSDIIFDKDFIIKKLWEAGFKSHTTMESFYEATQNETEKIIQEMNNRFVPKKYNNPIFPVKSLFELFGANILISGIARENPKTPDEIIKSKKNKKPFYKKLDRLKKWE